MTDRHIRNLPRDDSPRIGMPTGSVEIPVTPIKASDVAASVGLLWFADGNAYLRLTFEGKRGGFRVEQVELDMSEVLRVSDTLRVFYDKTASERQADQLVGDIMAQTFQNLEREGERHD